MLSEKDATKSEPDDLAAERNSPDLYEIRDTARLEAFSDGVFGVAISLLVLFIKLPPAHDRHLMSDLISQWPQFIAFFFSFYMIGIYWINHHHIFKYIKKTDQMLMHLNVALLVWIVLIPFGTGLLAEYIGQEPGLTKVAAVFFAGIWFATGISYMILWTYASRHPELLVENLDPAVVTSLTRDNIFGFVANLIVLIFAFINVLVSLTLLLVVTAYFAKPARKRGPHGHINTSNP